MGAKLSGGTGRFQLGQNSDINVTPFVDVMLVLLIIFMVALPAPVATLPLNLPPAKPPEGKADPPLVISLDPGGLFIDDTATTLAALPVDLARKLNKPNPTAERVYVRAARTVRYSRFMEVMNALQAAGFFQVALINEEI